MDVYLFVLLRLKFKLCIKSAVLACMFYKVCTFLLFSMLNFSAINMTVISYICQSEEEATRSLCYHV